MHKAIQVMKGNKYILLSAFLPVFIIFTTGFSFLWFLEKEQSSWLEERGFKSYEEYEKYRNKQQAKIYELNVDIDEMKKDLAHFSGDKK